MAVDFQWGLGMQPPEAQDFCNLKMDTESMKTLQLATSYIANHFAESSATNVESSAADKTPCREFSYEKITL